MQFRATYCKVIGYIWLVVAGVMIVVGGGDRRGLDGGVLLRCSRPAESI